MQLIFFLTGVVSWTLLEYVLHRFLGHEHKGKNFFKSEHVQHHAYVDYFAPAWKKALAATIFALSLIGFLSLVFSVGASISFVAGLIGMYALYEITHKRFHSRQPILKIFVPMRKHHFYHHFHNPRVNHGVTTCFWDRVFGTFKDVEAVQVPRKMVMNWLLEGDSISPKYQEHFRLKI